MLIHKIKEFQIYHLLTFKSWLKNVIFETHIIKSLFLNLNKVNNYNNIILDIPSLMNFDSS